MLCLKHHVLVLPSPHCPALQKGLCAVVGKSKNRGKQICYLPCVLLQFTATKNGINFAFISLKYLCICKAFGNAGCKNTCFFKTMKNVQLVLFKKPIRSKYIFILWVFLNFSLCHFINRILLVKDSFAGSWVPLYRILYCTKTTHLKPLF